MPLPHGSTLAFYQILGPLGAGAMGEVYRAKDTRLGREVAIKVLPEHFADDAERLKRFEREATTLASLNHPNVAQIHGVDQVGDICFLVLELVPGESLEERLKRGPLPLDEALDVCRQIAEGLEAAHEAGVIHRDLKPANVRITPDGRVKVLDFGLAKSANGTGKGSSTDSVLSTEAGRLLGTPTYMAPEQARGKAIDKRVDIWAFGCVLYECLSGQRAFVGDTVSDVLAAVIEREPDWTRLPAATPPRVRELIERCLAKDPRARLRDVGEARVRLQAPPEARSGSGASASGTRTWVPWGVSAALAAGLVFALLRVPHASSRETPREIHTSILTPPGKYLESEVTVDETTLLAISPDGQRVAFVATDGTTRLLYLRSLDSALASPVSGSEGASCPFFSPDGRWVAFHALGRLWKAPVSGGSPVELGEASVARGGAWGPDGTIVFPRDATSGLSRISNASSETTALTQLDPASHERSHRWPVFLPGGREVAFVVGLEGSSNDYEDCDIDAVSLETGRRRRLGIHGSFVRVGPGDQICVARGGNVSVVSLARLAQSPSPEPAILLQHVAGSAGSGAAHFDVALDGSLVSAPASADTGTTGLAWFAADGSIERLKLPPRSHPFPFASPDGSKIAVGIPASRSTEDLWIYDPALGSLTQLTHGGECHGALWTPDGRSIVYRIRRKGGSTIELVSADGHGEPEVLLTTAHDAAPLAWVRDGKELVCTIDTGPPNSADICVLDLSTHAIRMIEATTALEYSASVSPDGRWIAIATFESGRASIHVRQYPEGTERWLVSDSGTMPSWSHDGHKLFFNDGPSMMAVSVTTDPALSLSKPVKLFRIPFRTADYTYRNWSVGLDDRFLAVYLESGESVANRIDLVQHALRQGSFSGN